MVALPVQLGGLGITPVSAAHGLRHRFLSFHRTSFFLQKHHPTWVEAHLQRYGPRGIAEEFSREVFREVQEVNDPDPFQRLSKASRRVVERIDRTLLETRINDLAERRPTRPAAAMLISSVSDAGSLWLSSTFDPFVVGAMSTGGLEFSEAVRAHTFAPYAAGRARRCCDCNVAGQAPIDLGAEPYHPLVCPRNANIRTACHDAVKARLCELIKKSSENGVRVTMEPRNDGGPRRPDLVVERNGITTFIDVVIATPTSHAALAGPSGSSVVPLVAARLAEERKIRDYEGQTEAQEVIPFALEVTGRYGRAAAEYLGRLSSKVTEYCMRAFYRDVSYIVAFHFGRAFMMTRQRIHVDPGPPVVQ